MEWNKITWNQKFKMKRNFTMTFDDNRQLKKNHRIMWDINITRFIVVACFLRLLIRIGHECMAFFKRTFSSSGISLSCFPIEFLWILTQLGGLIFNLLKKKKRKKRRKIKDKTNEVKKLTYVNLKVQHNPGSIEL